jgi:hypothetical protein
MHRGDIEKYLRLLNDELCSNNVKGELCLYGGAVMCLAFHARPATKDGDAVFRPISEMREAIVRVATQNGLPADWINDAVKEFLVPHGQELLLDLPCLKVFIPDAEYLLAMKALAARVDATDRADVTFLIKKLGLTSPEEVFRVVEKYYPHSRIKPATRFFIEELFEQ